MKPTVFISYSHKDESWKNRLRPHLHALERVGHITLWDDRQIPVGSEWYDDINRVMDGAAVAVCLISADYLDSDFCHKEEIPYLLERRQRDGMILLPVLLRPCPWWAFDWLEEKQMLPRDGKSIAEDFQGREDGVFTQLAREIFNIVTDKNYQPPTAPPPRWSPPDKIDITRLPITGSDLFGRQQELTLLDEAWDAAATNVVSFVAWGGVGKSTLVNKWLERLAKDNYRGARRVYAWSFYSQGTSERATAADLFIKEALAWFGDPDPTAGSPWDKGERLAKLVRSEKTLLVLDGMEPLQSGLAYELGKIKDPALATLVTELARANDGLCVITTRAQIADLDEPAFVVPPLGGSVTAEADRLKAELAVQQINLEELSPEAGRALLRVGGVRGTDAELEQATEDFGRHALALNLLAAYLQDSPGHHISAAARIPAPDAPAAPGQHARRLLAAFAEKFGDGPELNVLRLLGLFDRPADGASIKALRQAPKLAGLTDHIGWRAKAKWLQAVQRLRKYKLIAAESDHAADELDAHPLVREHFRQQLQSHHPDAWREANLRLYEHLCATTKEFPATVEEMAPLYAAVAHGCAAGKHQQAATDVYWRRILRGEEFFSTKKLGAFGADLAALAGFFATPWQRPVGELTEAYQAFVLGQAGVRLRALGRLQEAAEPIQAALQAEISREDWKNAATNAANLSDLYLTIGDSPQALEFARQSVALAYRDGDEFRQMAFRTTLADALHQAGQVEAAEAAFRQAEELQKQRQPEYPILYSLWGFRYCDLLLGQGKHQEVKERAARTIEWMKQDGGLLDIALDNLLLGCAWLLQSGGAGAGDDGAEFLQRAVDGLRQAGQIQELPRGLLARAELRRVRGEYERARTDLAEAQRLAARSGMGLHLADCHLEWARWYLAQGDAASREQARAHYEQAQAMIARMGYHRRDKDVAEIAQALGETA